MMSGGTSSDVTVVEQPVRPTVAVRVQMPMSDLDIGQVFSEHISRINELIVAGNATPAGPPYIRYYEFGPDRADLEVGLPLGSAQAGLRSVDQSPPGEIGASELPGGPCAMTLHIGPYEELGRCYRRLESWMTDHGRTARSAPWESYLIMPGDVDNDQAGLRTEVYWPLASANPG